jgi:hypothetical protein
MGVQVIPMPAPFNKLERIKYFPDTDVMYLGGYTVDRPHTGEEWGNSWHRDCALRQLEQEPESALACQSSL